MQGNLIENMPLSVAAILAKLVQIDARLQHLEEVLADGLTDDEYPGPDSQSEEET